MRELSRLWMGAVYTMIKNVNVELWAAVLLLIGGLVHVIPPLSKGLTDLTGGVPWLQIIVGLISVMVALIMFSGKERAR